MNPIHELYTISMLAVAALLFAWRIGFFQRPAGTGELPKPHGWEVTLAALLYFGVQLAFVPVLVVIFLGLWQGEEDAYALILSSDVQNWISFAAAASALPALIGFAWYRDLRLWQPTTQKPQRFFIEWGKGVLTWLVAFPLVSTLGLTSKLVMRMFYTGPEPEQVAIQHLKNAMESPGAFFFAVLAITLFIPITEELLFRGFFQNWLKRHFSSVWAITVSSLVFALVHLSVSQAWMNVVLFISPLGLSCFLGYLYEREKSLWAPIGLHMVFNAFTVAMLALEAF